MTITEFIDALQEVAARLDALSRHDRELDEEVSALVGGASGACDAIGELMQIATHEEAGILSHYCEDISTLLRFFSFMRRFPGVDEDMFASILEPETVGMDAKRKLLGLGYDTRDALDLIENMRAAWRERFELGYSPTKERVDALMGKHTRFSSDIIMDSP